MRVVCAGGVGRGWSEVVPNEPKNSCQGSAALLKIIVAVDDSSAAGVLIFGLEGLWSHLRELLVLYNLFKSALYIPDPERNKEFRTQ